jgi:hypothetical protein
MIAGIGRGAVQMLQVQAREGLKTGETERAARGIFATSAAEIHRASLSGSAARPIQAARVPRPAPQGAPRGPGCLARIRERFLNLRSAVEQVRSAAGRRAGGLGAVIREAESNRETIRNKRQMASTDFQNFDQKANQLFNLLSNVMKAMNEMRMGTVRNML